MSNDPKIPQPEVSPDDTIAGNRALALPDPSSIPSPPAGYKPSEASDKQYLRRISDKLQAEAAQSLDECIEKGAKLAEDLGKNAPSLETLSKLRALKKQSNALKAKSQALLQFLAEKEDILNNDIAIALEKIGKELTHQIDTENPQFATEYPETMGYTNAHGESVREGREKAKLQKQSKE